MSMRYYKFEIIERRDLNEIGVSDEVKLEKYGWDQLLDCTFERSVCTERLVLKYVQRSRGTKRIDYKLKLVG